MLGVMRGAVTMKMISSTSITSMKGTMLISLMVRRPRPRLTTVAMVKLLSVSRGRLCAHIALQDVGKLFDESLQLDRNAVNIACKAVVGNHCGNSGKQANSGCHQGLGDTRGHRGKRHLLHGSQPVESMHDAPDRAK